MIIKIKKILIEDLLFYSLNYIVYLGGLSNKKRMESAHNYGLKFLIAFLILTVLYVGYSIFVLAYSSREILEYEKPDSYAAADLYNYIGDYQQEIQCEALTNEQIKSEIQKIIKPKFYIEVYTGSSGGRTYASLRIIAINKHLKGYAYAYTLIHEYIHLHYLLKDESLVDFLSVKLLWESNVPYLQKAACWLIKDKIENDRGNDYDCTAQLIGYFRINEGVLS